MFPIINLPVEELILIRWNSFTWLGTHSMVLKEWKEACGKLANDWTNFESMAC